MSSISIATMGLFNQRYSIIEESVIGGPFLVHREEDEHIKKPNVIVKSLKTKDINGNYSIKINLKDGYKTL